MISYGSRNVVLFITLAANRGVKGYLAFFVKNRILPRFTPRFDNLELRILSRR